MIFRSSFVRFLVPVALTTCVFACSAPESDGGEDADADRETGSGGSNNDFEIEGSGGSGLPPAMIETTLPAGFTGNVDKPTQGECGKLPGGQCYEPAGGYQRVGLVADVALDEENSCRNVLRGIVRDFDHAHADFGGDANGDGIDAGLVNKTLGADRKPVPTGSTPVATALSEWFTNGGGGNVPYVVDFWFEPVGDVYIFDSSRFFPVDGVGVLSGNDNDQKQRNFGFTTELHTKFRYNGGEVFNFTGDDDVFVFINNQLAVDLGGVHSQEAATVSIDAFNSTVLDPLGVPMVVGEVYNLDLFHAERNPTGSNFRIETSLDFQECGILESDIVVR